MNDNEYLNSQFDQALKNRPQDIKIKVISENGQTNWINVSPKQINAVLKALTKNLE